MAPALNVCTSGRRINDLSDRHAPCGRVLLLIGHTTKKRKPVEVCSHCDAAEHMPSVRELRAT